MNKKYRDNFSSFHPIVNFSYFFVVLLFTMFFNNPIDLIISLIASIFYSIYLRGKKAVKFNLLFMMPMVILTVIINPVFNHEGVTILRYFSSGNPLTLESIIYGVVSSIMLVSVINWFICYNEVMTTDKFVYLFGKIIPALSLVLSMTLRFIPRFKEQIIKVSNAQKALGIYSDIGFINKARHSIRVLSIVISWSLENAIDSSDSMKSRGYGLKGRTAFSIYKLDSRDKNIIMWIVFCFFYIFFAWASGGMFFRYYPSIKGYELNQVTISFHILYLLLCITPMILNVKEDIKWKRINY